MQIAIPRNAIGMEKEVNFNFKWVDNTQEDGDIMDFYKSGDATPLGRFAFVFRSTHPAADNETKSSSFALPWYTIVAIIAAGVMGIGAVLSRIFIFNKKKIT